MYIEVTDSKLSELVPSSWDGSVIKDDDGNILKHFTFGEYCHVIEKETVEGVKKLLAIGKAIMDGSGSHVSPCFQECYDAYMLEFPDETFPKYSDDELRGILHNEEI